MNRRSRLLALLLLGGLVCAAAWAAVNIYCGGDGDEYGSCRATARAEKLRLGTVILVR